MEKNKKLSGGVKEIYVGIDLHKVQWVVSIVSEGEFLRESVSIPSGTKHLLRMIEPYSHLPRHQVHFVYEAGCFGFWLCHELTLEGYDCIVTPPSLVPVESGNRVKTDKRDSKKLAMYLCKGLLKSIHIPAAEDLADRELTRSRGQLVSHRADVERQIKSKLLLFGYSWPPHHGVWTEKFIGAVKGIIADAPIKTVVESLLRIRENIVKEIKVIEEEIEKLSEKGKYAQEVKLLKGIHGIGNLTAMILLLELGKDLSRFNNSRQFCAYLGLTPSEYSSGENIRRGNITHAGNERIRSVLIESSWILIRRDKHLLAVYERLRARCGGKRAIVAIARRLACRIRQMLLHREEYRIAA